MRDLVEVTGHPVRGHQQSDPITLEVIGPQTLPKPSRAPRKAKRLPPLVVLPGVSLLSLPMLASPTGVVVVATVASATRPLALGPTLSPCLDCWLSSAHRSRLDQEPWSGNNLGVPPLRHSAARAQQGIAQHSAQVRLITRN